MKCRRAFEADLHAALHGDGDPEFLAHYPTCAECAAEIGVWRELDDLLRAGVPSDGAHPTEAMLLGFVDASASLSSETRAEIERHLARCRACADEARLLRTIDVTAMVAAAAPPAAPPAPAAPPSVPAESEPPPTVTAAPTAEASPAEPIVTVPPVADVPPPPARRGLLRVVWHPAFAYALVAVLLVPLVAEQVRRARVERGAARDQWQVQVAEEQASPPAVANGSEASVADESDAPSVASGLLEEKAAAPETGAAPPSAELRDLAAVVAPSADVDAPPAPPAAAPPAKADSPRQEAKRVDEATAKVALGRAAPAEPESRERGMPALRAPMAPGAFAKLQRHTGGPDEAPMANAEGIGAAAPPIVDLAAETRPTIALEDAERGARLRIAERPGNGTAALDVHVRGKAGGRELFERLEGGANAIELDIPAAWLTPGEYVVTVEPVGGRQSARRRFGFVVGTPAGAAARP